MIMTNKNTWMMNYNLVPYILSHYFRICLERMKIQSLILTFSEYDQKTLHVLCLKVSCSVSRTDKHTKLTQLKAYKIHKGWQTNGTLRNSILRCLNPI